MDTLITQPFLILLDSGAIIDLDVGFGPKAYYYTWSYSHDRPDRLYPSHHCIIWFRTVADPSTATQFFSSPPSGVHREKGQQSSEPRLS